MDTETGKTSALTGVGEMTEDPKTILNRPIMAIIPTILNDLFEVVIIVVF